MTTKKKEKAENKLLCVVMITSILVHSGIKHG